MPVSARALYDWHARPGAFERLTPPWEDTRVVSRTGGFADADIELRMRVGPFRTRWHARHEGHEEGRWFRDRQVSGPFASWVHTHRFEPAAEGSRLVDHVEYALPFGGPMVAGAIARKIERAFRFRHRRTREDLMLHANHPPLRVAITGVSGLVGRQLCALLESGGNTVLRLVRHPPGPGEARWDPAAGEIDAAALEGLDAVVHLAGESIARRWTAAQKAKVLRSRKDATRLLAGALARLDRRPGVLLSASAVGFYGSRGDEVLTEASPPGSGFLSDVCRAWEEATAPAEAAGIRTVRMRLGVVLSARGGALPQLLPPFRIGLGGPLGSGRQFFPWVAMDDVLGAVLHLLRTDVSGPVNVTAPEPVRQAEFARTLGKVLHRPAVIPTPAFAVKLLFGQMGEEVLLGGQRAVPSRLLESGYVHLRPDLADALAFELGADEPVRTGASPGPSPRSP